MGNVPFLGFFVEVFSEVLSGSIRMLRQIIVSSSGDSHEFLGSKGEGKGHIGTGLSVVGKAVPLVDVPSHQVFPQADFADQKVFGGIDPFLVVFRPDIVTGGDKVFDFHLFEFSRSENKVSGSDFVSEGLSHLGNPKGDLLAGGVENVLEIDKDTLSGFRSQVGNVLAVNGGTDAGFEHQVEVPGCRQGRLAGSRGGNLCEFLVGRLD
mmetsp:Transcript_9097/g.19667  ORF Transcript_9097/g.19667 Transcript_9097/m.19667 type:complete len:208 (-) Transcript_9097:943-1566(-)